MKPRNRANHNHQFNVIALICFTTCPCFYCSPCGFKGVLFRGTETEMEVCQFFFVWFCSLVRASSEGLGSKGLEAQIRFGSTRFSPELCGCGSTPSNSKSIAHGNARMPMAVVEHVFSLPGFWALSLFASIKRWSGPPFRSSLIDVNRDCVLGSVHIGSFLLLAQQ